MATVIDAEERDWQAAVAKNTVAAYQVFLNRYSAGQYSGEAVTAILMVQEDEQWIKASKKNTIETYQQFIDNNPSSSHVEDAEQAILTLKEDSDWKKTKAKNQLPHYAVFLKKYPNGVHAQEVAAIIDELKNKAKELQAAKKEKLLSQQSRPKKLMTPGKSAQKTPEEKLQYQEEKLIWGEASKSKAVSAAQMYLEWYPQGYFVKDARKMLKSFEGGNKSSKMKWIIAAVVLVLIIVALLIWQPWTKLDKLFESNWIEKTQQNLT